MPSLHRFLVDYEIAMLRALAHNRGIALSTNRQTEAADELATALVDPLSVRVAVAHLSSQGREALELLLAAGAKMRTPQFVRRYGQIRPLGPARLERTTPWQEPANATEELWYAGLIYRAFSHDEAGPGEFFFVPDEMLPLLPQPQRAPRTLAVETVDPPAHWHDRGPSLVEDLFGYLATLVTRDLRLHADGRLGKQDQAALHSRLLDQEPRRLALLRRLAEQLGFAAQEGGLLRLQIGPAKRWLTAAPVRQLALLQEAWRDDPDWDDLSRVPALVCERQVDWHPRNNPLATRRAVLALLNLCPRQRWWSLPSFVAAVKEHSPDFQRPDGDYGSWIIREATSGAYLSGFESWDRVEGALLTDLLTGPLQWLGVVAVAGREPGAGQPRVATCCLTEAGARFLDGVSDEPEAQFPPIVVHPDLCVDVPVPVNFYARFLLERFADLESRDPCRYRLTVAGLGRALARGVQVEQLLAFLQQAGDKPVPAQVAGQLHLWAGRYGQVALEEMALLTVKSERVLRELVALPETRPLIGRVLSPTSALVRRQDLAPLQKALRTLGYLPAEEPPE